MTDLFAQKRPLVIDTPEGGRRLIAQAFSLQNIAGKEGLVYLDTWWHGSFGHPVHVVPGAITGEGPWKIGEAAKVTTLGDQDGPLQEEWKLWQEYLSTEAGARATPKLALEIVKAEAA